MRKLKNRKRELRKKTAHIVLRHALLVFAVLFAVACLPYAGALGIKSGAVTSFDINKFYGGGTAQERVMLLEDPAEAFFHRINIVEKAETEINFSTHSISGEFSPYIFFEALLRAAGRGVAVNVTVDGKFGKIPTGIRDALIAHRNVTLTEYNPASLLKLQYANVALHDKILTVDNKYMIIGGRNLEDRFFPPHDYQGVLSHDREVLVYNAEGAGGSISEVRNYFRVLTQSRLSVLRKHISKAKIKKADKYRETLGLMFEEYKNSSVYAGYDYADTANTAAVNKITVVANPVAGTKKAPDIAYTLYMLAKHSSKVTIQSPYIVLTNKNIKYLDEIGKNVPELRIVTNSLANTPNLPGYSSYYIWRKKLLKTGADIYEYQGRDNVHAKAYMFDDRLCAVGSFNLDERSIRIDTEIMLIIDSTELAALLNEDINRYAASSLQVGADNKYIFDENVTELKNPIFKKFVYTVTGALLLPVRYLI